MSVALGWREATCHLVGNTACGLVAIRATDFDRGTVDLLLLNYSSFGGNDKVAVNRVRCHYSALAVPCMAAERGMPSTTLHATMMHSEKAGSRLEHFLGSFANGNPARVDVALEVTVESM